MATEHIQSVMNAANTQTCLIPELRESMRVVAQLAANSAPVKIDENKKEAAELSINHFASKLKTLRQERNITQTQLADLCGWSQSRIGNYEKAKREPSFSDINSLSKAFGVLPSDLLFG